MEAQLCQSCGMPLADPTLLGTNKDGSENDEYCIYCYKNGGFTEEVTMDEMIENCIRFLDEFNKDAEMQLTKEEATAQMKQFFPQLKRWKNS